MLGSVGCFFCITNFQQSQQRNFAQIGKFGGPIDRLSLLVHPTSKWWVVGDTNDKFSTIKIRNARMIARKIIAGVCGLALAATGQAQAQNTDITYLKVSDARDKTLVGCNITSFADRVIVKEGGRRLALPRSADRKMYAVPGTYNFFGCGLNNNSQLVIFAKKKATSQPVELALSDANFPPREESQDDDGDTDGRFRAECTKVAKFPGSFIYKTVGSHHFTDCRRNTHGLIVKPGVRANWPSKADVVDREGNLVSVMGLYATGSGWSARYYACVGAGRSYNLDGFDVARRARGNTGSSSVYLRMGSTCFGPIPAERCIGSKAC
jgi:hypothetical protein